MGRLSLPSGIFSINEPIIFGLPIILNPLMALPFIITPVLNTIVAYLATILGLIPITNSIHLPWTMPIGFSGYLLTESMATVVLQFGILALNMLIYYSFMRRLDKKYLEEERAKVNNLTFN